MKFSTAISVATALAVASPASAEKMGFAGQVMDKESFKDFEDLTDMQRVMEVTKLAWPECLKGELNNAKACEAMIDKELAAMDLSFDVYTIILYTRTFDCPTAHAWVIPIDDDGMCVGKYRDGRLFYEYEWCVDEEVELTDPNAIKESQKLIKPSKWTELIASNPSVSCLDVDQDGDLDAWHKKALETIGGDYQIACSDYETYLDKKAEIEAQGPIVHKGCQRLPEFNCKGLSGVDACKLVKQMVPYPNTDGKNLECYLQYLPDSPIHDQMYRDLRKIGEEPKTRVIILAKKETDQVIATPLMKGPGARLGKQ
mmetsp:Transcript_6459/g.13602  ORF Transcript_6459/g.13602 Transcript_6459/m.13602 type:complete len:313 (+) Transcript_6459:62-1000(+)